MIQSQLLFFDTFSHDTQSLGQPQDINLDLVQFPSPVYIREVRVIPLGSKVTANLPGGMRLGATNPSKFDLELFVNNLAAPGASTFESVGSLHYNQAGSISLTCTPEIATDGLVLRGLYSTITLAVYGSLSDCTPEQLARQGAAAREEAAVKEEPVLELPGAGAGEAGASDNGRSLGEAYAAQWTEKHSDQALKAEPPDDDNWAVSGVKLEPADKTNGTRFAIGDKDVRTKGYYDNDGDIKREKVSSPDRDDGSKHGDRSPRNPDRTRKRYSDSYRSTSRDRARSPPASRARDRDKSRDRERSRDKSRDRDLLRDRSRDRFSRERDRSLDRFSRDKERTRDRRSRSRESKDLRDKQNDSRGKDRDRSRDRTPDRSERFRDRRLSPELRTSKRDRSLSPRDRRSLSRPRSRTPPRRDRDRSRSPRRFSRSRSPDKKSYRSVSRDRDRFSNDRYRPSSSLTKDSRDYNRPVTPTRERYRDNFRENHISDSRRPRSPVSRDRSPYDYDKTSLHSSGSRRPLSPKSSPRRRGTRSPSSRFRRDRSRSFSGSRRSRSPRSPNITNGNHVKHRTPERNGFKSSSPTPAKEVVKEDILDAVSDISDGDIPDDPDNDADASGVNDDRMNDEDDLATTRSSIAKEDVEEISDEEAEWSDDFETGVFSDTDIEVGDDFEDPVVYFNPAEVNLKRLESLSDPTENLLDQIKTNKVSASKSEKPFMDTVESILLDVYDEKFIETIEGLTRNIQIELAFCNESEVPYTVLARMVTNSIHFENAMKQLKPPSKVRQLKSGLKLLIEMLNCGEELTEKLLESDIQENLLSLYTREHMAISLKLLILKALDTSLNSVIGIEHFAKKNLFGKLLQLSGENHSSRTQFSFSSILTKLDLNDQLNYLNTVISQADHFEQNSEVICEIIENLRTLFLDINLRMTHPARFLPSQLHYDTSLTEFGSPKTSYFTLMSRHGVLEVVTTLLACPDTSDLEPVVTSLHRLLSSWMMDEAGLLYLANQAEQTSSIVRTLMGNKVETEEEEAEAEGTRKDSTDDIEGPTTGYELGFHLNQLVTAVGFMDKIQRDVRAANMVRLDMETSDTYSAIANLYGMTLTPRGREAVVSVVTMGSLADNIIALTKHNSEDGKKDMKKSAIRGFASEILLLAIRSSDNVTFLRRYGTQLITIGNSDSHSKLSELVGWCAPLADPVVFTEEGISVLANIVRQRLEQSEAEKSSQQTKSESILSSELVTAVRLLRDHVSPRTRPRPHLDMKYKAAAIVMFSNDLVELFTQLLDRITADHEQPHLHTATFIGSRGATIIAILQPVLASLRTILEAVIEARDTEFQDLSVLPALLRTHSLLSVVPAASVYYSQARDTIGDLVKCLLAFTKPNVDLAKNKMSKSLWTQMMSSLLSYISSIPAVLMSSLGLLSQILPLPLPLPSPRELTSDEETSVSTSRKLWSAHLHPLRAQLARVISDVSAYAYPPLMQLLQKVCDQLSSLSPPIALIVVTSMVTSIRDTEPGPALSRMTEFLVWCVTQPAIKTVLMDAMASEASQRVAVIGCLEHCLAGDSETQAGAIRVVQTLCDPGISLSGENLDLSLSESLPDKETLQSLINCLLGTSETKGFSSQSSLFSCLMAMTETQYMCDLVRWSLLNNAGKEKYLFLLLKTMVVEFSAQSKGFESFLTFITHLHDPDLKDDNILTLVELGMALGWLCPDESTQQSTERRRTHPLVVLSNRIKEIESESQDLSLTNTSVKYAELITLLESLPADTPLPSLEAPSATLPPPRTPLELWAARDTVVGAGDISSEQLSMVYWTHGDMDADTGAAEAVTQTLDLLGVSQKYLSGLDIQSAAKEVTKERTLATERKKKGVKKSMMETKVLQNKNIISAFKDGKNVNLRGRGFARTTFKSDQFRTRPPNTSRPPSLHVDDFLVLELKGQQPTGPTGYNKQSVKAAKELFAQREADAMLKPPQMMREATREPVGISRGRGRGERGGERSGATRGFRGSGSSNGRFRRESRGWSPTSSEPRDLGREARPGPREDRRGGGGRGGGSYRGDRRGGGGGTRGDRKFSRGGGRR